MQQKETEFLELLKVKQSAILKMCGAYVNTRVEKEDLFQEVVFQIWKSWDSFKNEAKRSTWVYRITINVCLQSQLRNKKHKTHHLDALYFQKIASSTEEENTHNFQTLNSCIQKLKGVDKSIIILFLEGFAYREISEVCGLSENYIAVKMKRIKKKLTKCFNLKNGKDVR